MWAVGLPFMFFIMLRYVPSSSARLKMEAQFALFMSFLCFSDALLHNICKVCWHWEFIWLEMFRGAGEDLVCVNSQAIRQLCFFYSSENWKMASQEPFLKYTWQSGELFCLKSSSSTETVRLLPLNGWGRGPRPIVKFKYKLSLHHKYSQRIWARRS